MTMEEIEDFIDQKGLGAVVGILVEICYLKAEHVRTNWQDEFLSRQWEKQGKEIDNLKFYRVE